MNSYESPLPQAKIKALNKLKQKKYRYITNTYLCEGWRLYFAASKFNPQDILEIIINDNFKDGTRFPEIREFCSKSNTPIFSCTDNVFKTISDEKSPAGLMFVMKLKYYQNPDIAQINDNNCIYLENISDPGNLGTIIRTAAWFGIDHIFLSNESVDPFNAKVVRASAGGIFNVNLYINIDLEFILEFGNKYKYDLIGTTLENGKKIDDWKVSDKNIIFFGNEANGLTDLAKQSINNKITVPGSGKMESLNLSVTSGIILNHLYSSLNI